ncbi:transcriptional repressor [Halosquirtibacter xylanolyticus]|uniref:Fur family transcriptional regulator n=1 Tax=Halosquirtibacter xylanolyticus TaxID=3374599 RepID=UPI0037480D94|nr:transcriptional repressor [Prolixibacteraceae bacterium]
MNDTIMKAFLEEKEVRVTNIRLSVMNYFYQHQYALSLTDLETDLDDIDRSTLFRTIRLFIEKKIVHEVGMAGGHTKYALWDIVMDENDNSCVHFTCLKCHHSYCFPNSPTPEVTLPNNFVLDQCEVIVRGLCDNCSI